MADIIHSKGEAGGYLVGNRHTEGGIKAINKSTGQPLEMEGGEVVITRNAVSDTTKRSFNGKMMTNREILSSINKSGGGVEFEEGGEVPSSIEYVDALLEYDGEQSDARRMLEKMAVGGQVSDILDDLKDIYAQGGQAANPEIIELESVGHGFDVENLKFLIQNEDGTFDREFVTGLEDADEDFLNALSEEDLVKIDLAANGSNQTIGRLLTQKRIAQGGVAPQLEPRRDLKLSFYLNHNSTLGPREVELSQIYDIPSVIINEVKNAYFNDDKFSVWVKATLFDNFIAQTISVSKDYFLSEALDDNLRYSEIVNSLYFELEKYGAFTKPFQDLYKQATKLYVVGFNNPQILTSNEPNSNLADVTSIYNYKDNDPQKGFRLEPFVDFSNFQSFEKISKKLISQKVTKIALRARLEIRTLSSAANTSMRFAFGGLIIFETEDFVNGKGLSKKWDWWKKNIFEPAGHFSIIDSKDKAFSNFLDDLNFEPFECQYVTSATKKRSVSQQKITQTFLEKGAEASNVFVYDRQDGSSQFINKPFELKVRQFYKFDTEINLIYPTSTNPTNNREIRIRQDGFGIFCAGEKNIFYFGYRQNLYFEFDQEKAEREKLERAELERQSKENRAEIARLLREQKKLEQEKELALKNRPFKVRDQQKDVDFFPLEAARGAFREEIRALKIMLSFTGTEKLRDERALIVQKISALERKDVKLALKELNRRPGETLMSPENLLEYYYTQATQSPIVQLGPPCGKSTPTGAPSKLPLQSYEAVRTSFFKSWFGDWEMAYANQDYAQCSMLVDEETAEPKMMYHGVRQKIEGLTTGNMGSGINRPYAEFSPPNFPATYFGDSIDYVKFYAGEAENQPKPTANYEGYIYNVFIKMQNPVILVGLGLNNSYRELLVYIYLNYGVKIEPSTKYSTLFNTPGSNYKVWNYIRYDINLIEKLKSAGYDGIIQLGDVPAFDENQAPKEQNLLGSEYLVFSAEQIKDASIKNSFYLPFIKDIRFKEGGNVRL